MAFPRYLGGNVEKFCDELVKKAGVLLLPGSVYDDSSNHFRLGLGRKNLPQAVERLEEFLIEVSSQVGVDFELRLHPLSGDNEQRSKS
jgi:aspartate/methionine/tyrosine aminotransferase